VLHHPVAEGDVLLDARAGGGAVRLDEGRQRLLIELVLHQLVAGLEELLGLGELLLGRRRRGRGRRHRGGRGRRRRGGRGRRCARGSEVVGGVGAADGAVLGVLRRGGGGGGRAGGGGAGRFAGLGAGRRVELVALAVRPARGGEVGDGDDGRRARGRGRDRRG